MYALGRTEEICEKTQHRNKKLQAKLYWPGRKKKKSLVVFNQYYIAYAKTNKEEKSKTNA